MPKIEIYMCDSMFCDDPKKHVLAIVKKGFRLEDDVIIDKSEMKCTDSVTRFYTTDSPCACFDFEFIN